MYASPDQRLSALVSRSISLVTDIDAERKRLDALWSPFPPRLRVLETAWTVDLPAPMSFSISLGCWPSSSMQAITNLRCSITTSESEIQSLRISRKSDDESASESIRDTSSRHRALWLWASRSVWYLDIWMLIRKSLARSDYQVSSAQKTSQDERSSFRPDMGEGGRAW